LVRTVHVPHPADREARLGADIQCGVKRRLGVNLCVVLFENGQPHVLQILGKPVDFERPRDCFLEALVAFENGGRAGDAVGRQQRRMGRRHRGVRIGKPFPMR
jgi:hypothetical protein